MKLLEGTNAPTKIRIFGNAKKRLNERSIHWVKNARNRSYSGPHFLAFGLNIQYECSKCGPE